MSMPSTTAGYTRSSRHITDEQPFTCACHGHCQELPSTLSYQRNRRQRSCTRSSAAPDKARRRRFKKQKQA